MLNHLAVSDVRPNVQGSNPFERDSEVTDAIENIADTLFSLEEKLKKQNDESQNKIDEQVFFLFRVFEWHT